MKNEFAVGVGVLSTFWHSPNQPELEQYSSLDGVFGFQFITSGPVPSCGLGFSIINVHANHLVNVVKIQILIQEFGVRPKICSQVMLTLLVQEPYFGDKELGK